MRIWIALLAVVSITSMALSVVTWRAVVARDTQVPDALQTIADLLTEREAAVKALQQPPFAEGSSSVLDAYLMRLRRDGAVKSATMRQRLDQLAKNTIALETLLDLSASRSNSPAFKSQVNRFDAYASAWMDRWNSMSEIFMAGGALPAAEIPFPDTLAAAIRDELRKTR
jgi:hypothetical protein